MARPIQLAVGSKLSDQQLKQIVSAYSRRTPVTDLHRRTGISRNTLYWYYGLIRERLVEAAYYSTDPVFTRADKDAYAHIKNDLKRLRGLRENNFGWHVSELTFWMDEPDPSLVLKHIFQIIRLTGPLGYDPLLNDREQAVLRAYVALAHVEIVANMLEQTTDPSDLDIERTHAARAEADLLRKRYLAARKRMLRARSRYEPAEVSLIRPKRDDVE
jgi:hypothetical protein